MKWKRLLVYLNSFVLFLAVLLGSYSIGISEETKWSEMTKREIVIKYLELKRDYDALTMKYQNCVEDHLVCRSLVKSYRKTRTDRATANTKQELNKYIKETEPKSEEKKGSPGKVKE